MSKSVFRKPVAALLCIIMMAAVIIPGISESLSASAETDTEQGVTDASITVTDGNGYEQTAWAYNGITYLFLDRASDLSSVTVVSETEITAADSEDAVISSAKNAYSVTYDFFSDKDLVITLSDGTQKTLEAYQSSLPSLTIELPDGTSLDDVHKDKDTKHKNCTVSVSGSDNDIANVGKVELKGRGNTSWTSYDKKGYQIKFDKKQSVLGMEKAKKWLLLANSSDPSMLRNKLAFTLGQNLGLASVTDSEYADLWINGEYRGTYLVTEKIEIGDGRVELSEDGVIYEFDNDFYKSEDGVITDSRENHFVLKDPDVDEVNQSSVNSFLEKINSLETGKLSWADVQEIIDVESFAKVYLVNEYLRNDEFGSTSNYMYMDGTEGKVTAGPLWDFDTSMYAYSSDGTGMYVHNNNLYKTLLHYASFRRLVRSVYEENKLYFENLAADETQLASEISSSAHMNQIRWANTYGTTDLKGQYSEETWEKNVENEIVWLNKRYAAFSVDVIPGTVQSLYRVYNPNSGEHFYTTQESEKNYLVSLGWTYEGIGWTAPSNSNTPVYRLYNQNGGEHHYTIDTNEVEYLVSLGWTNEGIGWYSDDEQTVPLYRQYNPNAFSCNHNYTVNTYENDWLVSLGWQAEGIGWYGVDG